MKHGRILALLAIIIMSMCGCDEAVRDVWHETTIVIEDTTPDILEDNTTDVVVIHETVTVYEEDTTPDVVYVYEYPSGPVPCLMLEENGGPAMADSPTSGLTAATVLNDADLFAITQGGTSKKLTANLIRQLSFLDPRYGYIDHEEWHGPTSDSAGENNWSEAVVGAGAQVTTQTGVLGRSWLLKLETGTTNAGRAASYRSGGSGLLAGAGETEFDCSVEMPILSDGAETYTLYIGFGDTLDATDFTDGIYFRYSHGLSSGNWERCTADNGVRTQQSTGIAVAAATWTHLGARINAGGTSVDFLINGAAAGTITTNIPTGTTRLFSPIQKIVKSVGATTRVLYEDFYQFRQRFTTPR